MQALSYLTEARNVSNSADITEDERNKIIKLNDINVGTHQSCFCKIKCLILVGSCTILVYVVLPRALKRQELFKPLPSRITIGKDHPDGKSILLLEEQAMETMQFATLVPALLNEPKHVGLFVSNRLYPVYVRSFQEYIAQGVLSVYSFDDVNNGRLTSIDLIFNLVGLYMSASFKTVFF